MVSHKKVVVVSFSVMALCLVAIVSMMSLVKYDTYPVFNQGLPVEVKQIAEFSTDSGKLKAMLKGSIYETGELMTVFGACFDGYGYLIADNDLNATFASWYPNGTQWEVGQPMMPVLDNSGNQTGRYSYQVTMPTTMGTYLTEITCMYEGDTANAYGEWQNPDWVRRIRETQESLANFTNVSESYYNSLSNQVLNFSETVQVNFSQVLSQLNNISISGSVSLDPNQLNDIYNLVRSMDYAFWAVDTSGPFYVSLDSPGNDSLSYVDIVSPQNIFVAKDSRVFYYDGDSWSELDVSGITPESIVGISAVEGYSPTVYIATSDGVSYNGDAPVQIPGASSNFLWGIKAFRRAAGEEFRIYVVTDEGEIFYSPDNGTTWENPINGSQPNNPDDIHISQVLWNPEGGENDYYVLFSGFLDDEIIYYNGSDYLTIAGPDSYPGDSYHDAILIRKDFGYVIGGDSSIYLFDGSSLAKVFDAGQYVHFDALAASSENSVWVGGSADSGVFYYYDGVSWEFSEFPYSGLTSRGFLESIKSISLFNNQIGYAAGNSGNIFKLYTPMNSKLDAIGEYVNGGFSELNMTLNDVKNVVLEINQTFASNITEVLSRIELMNNSVNLKLDEVIANQTYMQIYLETSLFPMLNATYQNTLSILIQLGIIEAKVDVAIDLSNQTLIMLNETKAGVDELLNSSRRIRAWITV